MPPGPGDLDALVAHRLVDEVIESRLFKEVGFTGGEPLVLPNLVSELGLRLSRARIPWGLTTGMGWAKNERTVRDNVQLLHRANLSHINISVDESHLKNRDGTLVELFIDEISSGPVEVTISSTSYSAKPTIPIRIPERPNIAVEYHYVAPVGFATNSKTEGHKAFSLSSSHCPMQTALTLSVWPDGSVYPCCSTYVVNKSVELVVGNVHDSSLEQILNAALNDPYLSCIRQVGFTGLIYLTRESDETWKSAFNAPVQDACHLCKNVAETTGAIRGIRDSLSMLST